MPGKTFYIETFGCQMNAHDSEKVIGTLLQQGYAQVETPEDAGLVLYNTCSIRDKAEQKVFNRLQNFKRDAGKGKIFGVLGCVAQQEGEKIFDRAPHVSLVCGSASYTKLPEMLVQLEAGNRRVTGLSLDTDETFDTPFTRRDNPHRAYITIIEGCDKSCAYCVVPFTRGPERSRTSESVMGEARRLAEHGLHRNPTARPERQQLSRSLARGLGFRHAAGARRRSARHPPRALSPPRIRAISSKRSSTRWTPIRCSATTCTCRCSPARRACWPPCSASTRATNTCARIEWMKNAQRALSRSPPTSSSASPARPRRISRRRSTCWTKCSTIRCSASSTRRARTPPRWRWTTTSPRRRSSGGWLIVQEKQRAIQIRRNAELIGDDRGGAGGRPPPGARASGSAAPRDNRTLNFTHPGTDGESLIGKYLPVRVTRVGPELAWWARAVNCGVMKLGRASWKSK